MKTLVLAGAILASATAASAATTGFTVSFNGDNNLPTVVLTNTGDLGSITGFSITIGDTAFNFDAGYDEVLNGVDSFTLTSGDDDFYGSVRVDTLSYTTVGFDAGDSFQFNFDVDPDNRDAGEDYQDHVLPGGSFSVQFAGGVESMFQIDLTPTPGNDSEPYLYGASATDDMSAVPLPAGLPLLLVGLGALGALRSRRS